MKLYLMTLVLAALVCACEKNPLAEPSSRSVVHVSATLKNSASSTPASPWFEVSVRTACEAMERAACLGYYGMTIDHQGQVSVGPDESGHTATGQLTPEELSELNSRAITVAQGDLSATVCDNGTVAPGTSETLALTLRSRSVMKIYDRPGVPATVCYLGGKDRVEALRDVVSRLMQKYYPQPFPAIIHAGLWGGPHIGVKVDEHGARVHLDCAQAVSTQPWRADSNYEFQAQGQLILTQNDNGLQPRNVVFHGSIYGQIMTLNIHTLPGDGVPLNQTFTLVYGKPAALRGCPRGDLTGFRP